MWKLLEHQQADYKFQLKSVKVLWSSQFIIFIILNFLDRGIQTVQSSQRDCMMLLCSLNKEKVLIVILLDQ